MAKLTERRGHSMAFPQNFLDELIARSDIVDVVVLGVDEKRHRISLSMKQASKTKAV